MNDEPETKNAKKELEEMRAKVNEEFSKETEDFTPPEVVERVNQILNDAAAGEPAEKIEPPPKVDVMEKVRQQVADALAQMNVSEEVASKVTGIVGEPAEKPADPIPTVKSGPAWTAPASS